MGAFKKSPLWRVYEEQVAQLLAALHIEAHVTLTTPVRPPPPSPSSRRTTTTSGTSYSAMSPLLSKENDGLRIVTDDRVNATATAERSAADALPNGSFEKADALVRMKHAELAARNVPGGYWVAAADPAVVSYALAGEALTKTIRRLAVLTDGATRARQYKLYNWSDLLWSLTFNGPSELIRQIRIAENADAAGISHPRNKIHDDATVALIQF